MRSTTISKISGGRSKNQNSQKPTNKPIRTEQSRTEQNERTNERTKENNNKRIIIIIIIMNNNNNNNNRSQPISLPADQKQQQQSTRKQPIMFPTKNGVRQRVSVHQPNHHHHQTEPMNNRIHSTSSISSSSSSTPRPRPPMKPVSINSSSSSLLPRPSSTATATATNTTATNPTHQQNNTSSNNNNTSNNNTANQRPKPSTPTITSYSNSLGLSTNSSSYHSTHESTISSPNRQPSPSIKLFPSTQEPDRSLSNRSSSAHSEPNNNNNDNNNPNNLNGLLNFDFGSPFNSHSQDLMINPLDQSQSSFSHPSAPTSPDDQPLFDLRLGSSLITNSSYNNNSLSHYPQTLQDSRRDTLRSLSDLINTSSSSHTDFLNSISKEPSSSTSPTSSSSHHSHNNNSTHNILSKSINSFSSSSSPNSHPITPNRSTSNSSSSDQFRQSLSSTSSPPPSSKPDPVSEPTPKPKSSSLSTTPFLLDLDISGRGPSLGDSKPVATREEEEEDDDDDDHHHHHHRESTRGKQLTSLDQQQPGARQIITAEEDDPYSSSNDDDEDAQSIQYTGSSCDDHSNPPQEALSARLGSNGPYMNRQISDSAASVTNNNYRGNPSTEQGYGHPLANKKSFHFFKLSHSRASSNQPDSEHPMIYNNHGGTQHSSQSSFKHDYVEPSPVSSLTSFNTTGSKSSTKTSSSSRMARLLSRVTGGSSSSLGGGPVKPRPQLPKSSSAQHVHSAPALPTPTPATAKPMRRKGSISNFLDTITISRDKAKPPSSYLQQSTNTTQSEQQQQQQPQSQPTIVPRKSFDMLMRPFLSNKPKSQPSPSSPTPLKTSLSCLPSLPTSSTSHPPNASTATSSRPLLKAKRSYDMLKGKLGNGRKSMDDLSNTAPLSGPASAASAAQQQRTKKIVASPSLLSEAPPSSSTVTPAPSSGLSKNGSRGPADSGPPHHQRFPSTSHSVPHNLGGSNDHARTQALPGSATDGHLPKHLIPPLDSSSPSSASPAPIDHQSHLSNGAKASKKAIASVERASGPRVIDQSVTVAEWNTLESILMNFQSKLNQQHQQHGGGNEGSSRIDLTAGLTNHLLPFLKAEESFPGSVYLDQKLAANHRNILLGWLELIFDELREPLPTSRAACLDGVSGILESHFFASHNINSNPEALKQYRSVLVSVLNFAIDKLNDKAVYANTLVFAGRMLSLAFFRIEGVGRKLLRALPPVKRMSMRRLLDEMESTSSSESHSSSSQPPNLQPFPAYLRELCFVDLNSYCRVFSSPSLESDNLLVQEGDIQVEMSGNWLIRWTASDSDLPFAFYRAYHRQLATYLRPQERQVVHPSTLISMPGFLLVSASFLDKCDSLVHRSLRSVTTLGPTANNFNAGESANLAMGAKPKVLELAHRRLVSTALDIVGGSPKALDELESSGSSDDSERRRQFFGGLLNLWIRAITKRTSMWDTRSVFLLLDFLDGLFYTVLYTAPAPPPQLHPNELPPSPIVPKLVEPSLQLFDLHFILDVLRRILITADNTVCIMRTIAFIYSQFEALTTRPETLKALCLDLLLDPLVFQHLFLHWNSGVRGYYMRLLVWRLSRLNGSNGGQKSSKSKDVVKIILAFNSRLDAIRKRHDQLSPVSEFLGSKDEEDRRRRRTTICSTRGVSDKPWAISELPPEEVCSETVDERYRDPTGLLTGGSGSDKPSVAKVVSWLKVVKRLGGSSKPKQRQEYPSPEPSQTRLPSESSQASHHHQAQLGANERAMAESRHGSPVRSIKPDDPASPSTQVELSELENESVGRKSECSVRSNPAHGPESPTFFQFEFELGAEIPRSDSFDTPVTTPSASESPATANNNQNNNNNLNKSGDSSSLGGSTGHNTPAKASIEPRVSSRFSKRASLLPPAALDMLKDNDGSEEDGSSPVPDVPSVPSQYITTTNTATSPKEDEISRKKRKKREKEEREARLLCYDSSKHPYAVKALAEYEQSLEEEFEWKEKLIEEHQLLNPSASTSADRPLFSTEPGAAAVNGKKDADNGAASMVDVIVPRLAVSWPLSFSEDD
ncbi:hypothetical protein PGTUg99_008638 [Puccinia graminis f. sp. tritici]|uniref:Uncharacterized protein n=1 Tax=Puccinia graminis f. sp. tritici TaxID=56615 RepID=A0A5B0SKA4_PUCGR|nr:hypothetical protein PGTUg99_008638 [Puccinia graminis f. sp. tritici]